MSNAKPLSMGARISNYRKQGGGPCMTNRQLRRLWKKEKKGWD